MLRKVRVLCVPQSAAYAGQDLECNKWGVGAAVVSPQVMGLPDSLDYVFCRQDELPRNRNGGSDGLPSKQCPANAHGLCSQCDLGSFPGPRRHVRTPSPRTHESPCVPTARSPHRRPIPSIFGGSFGIQPGCLAMGCRNGGSWHCGLKVGRHCQSPAPPAFASMPNPTNRWCATLLAGCRLRSWRRKMGIRGREMRYDANRG